MATMVPMRNVLNAFWGGFNMQDDAVPLDELPEQVTCVTLAFTGPSQDSGSQGKWTGYSTDFLCRRYGAEKIKGWVKTVQGRGTKVLMSVMDTPDTHWENVDIPAFVRNAVEVIVGEWGCDGVDIDGESGGATVDDFVQLVGEFRRQLPQGALLTYDAYKTSGMDPAVVQAVAEEIDWVNLMAYFMSPAQYEGLFSQYTQWVGGKESKLAIGVKCGKDGAAQSTPLSYVSRLVDFASDTKRGIMLYDAAIDCPSWTGLPRLTYVDSIIKWMKPQIRSMPGAVVVDLPPVKPGAPTEPSRCRVQSLHPLAAIVLLLLLCGAASFLSQHFSQFGRWALQW
eukprot:Sspe_Gene.109870::Locus_90099_Transcript_1_3_Confidence_0.400_Length_1105::g.109870::m.109870